MKKLSTEEIMHLQSCLEFGFSDNDICAQLSNDDLKKLVKIYEFTYFSVANMDYFFEELDSFQEAAVLFESVKFVLKEKENLDENVIINIAASTLLMSLSDRKICRYGGLFHDEMTIEMETVDINDFKERYPSFYHETKESFQEVKSNDNNICKQLYGYSIFIEDKYENIRDIQKNGMKMSIKKKQKVDDK